MPDTCLLHHDTTPPDLLAHARAAVGAECTGAVLDRLTDDELGAVCAGRDVLLLPAGQPDARRADELRLRAAVGATAQVFGVGTAGTEVVVDISAFLAGQPELAVGSAAATAVGAAFEREPRSSAFGFSVCSAGSAALLLDTAARRAAGRTVTVGHKANSIRATDGLLALEVARRLESDDVRWESLVIDHLAALLTAEPARFEVLVVAELYAPLVLGVLAASSRVTGAHLLLGPGAGTVRVAGSALVDPATHPARDCVDVVMAMS